MKNKFEKSLHDFIPNYPSKGNKDTYIVKSGKRLKHIKTELTSTNIIKVLENIHDPEIPVNIYDLGLIYDIKLLSNNNVQIKMSLTSPGCPVAGEMPKEVADKISELDNVGEVEVELIWDPPWTIDRMSDDARLALDIV